MCTYTADGKDKKRPRELRPLCKSCKLSSNILQSKRLAVSDNAQHANGAREALDTNCLCTSTASCSCDIISLVVNVAQER